MSNRIENLFSSPLKEEELKTYALEGFAREIDFQMQTELLTKLILEHSQIALRLEKLNKELLHHQEMLTEAHKIALLGRWDYDFISGEVVWSESMYDILEVESSTPASIDLFFSLVHPEDLENIKKTYQKMLAGQGLWKKRTSRYRLLLKRGKIKWVHFRFFAKLDEQNEIIGVYGTIQDITELKEIEDQLERYSKHLEQLVDEKVKEISSSQLATIHALIKLSGSRDNETGDHIERTASFCRLLASKLQAEPEYAAEVTDLFIETIYKASPLHDIGKVGIPDSILRKPGKLTDDEFTLMKTHVEIGYKTLAEVGDRYDGNEFIKMGIEIAAYHHEKWDGTGYVKGLRGKEIPLSARIMAISDVYDALRSKRVYKEAYSHKESVERIKSSSGSHFDPGIVDVFCRYQEEFELLYDSIK